MSYTVISDLEVCGKFKGDLLTEKELIDAGANIDALIEAGHVKNAAVSTKPATDEGDK